MRSMDVFFFGHSWVKQNFLEFCFNVFFLNTCLRVLLRIGVFSFEIDFLRSKKL